MTINELRRRFPGMSKDMINKNLGETLTIEESLIPKASVSCKPTTDESKLNKWEAQWLAVLRSRYFAWIGIQSVTLKLADDCRYTPDFWTLGVGGKLIAWEVKGFMREDAKIKIKVAARIFSWVQFVLVTRDGKSWKESVVKP